MNKNYIYIIIFFWFSILSTNTNFTTTASVLYSSETHKVISKDSLLSTRRHSTDQIKKDTTKTKLVAKDPLMEHWQKEEG